MIKGRTETILLLLLLAATLLAPPLSRAAEEYLVGARDVISISVYEQPDLTKDVRVTEDGTVSLPLVGQVKVAGLSVESLEAELETRYREFILDPQVSVFIKEYHSKEVSVLGEVSKPGLYQLSGDSTLLELLSKVGGFSKDAGDRIVILRKAEGSDERERIIIDTRKLFAAGGGDENVVVRDGDSINVPRADFFYVFGEVKSPGSYKMDRDTAITVLKAITLAGGFTDTASKRGVKITREVGGSTMEFKVDMSSQVQPEDIIVVPKSFF